MENEMMQPAWTKVAEVELIYKTTIKPSERPLIQSPKDSYELLKNIWDNNRIEFQEEFKVLLLNRGKKVIGLYEVSTGGMTETVADTRLILAAAIKGLAVSIILCHNHPSGNLKPSQTDFQLTQKIKHAAAFFNIGVIDHIIMTSEAYYSFAEQGLL